MLDYLTLLYDSGLKYSAINTARSALSSFVVSEDGRPMGKHPLVVRFMKGVFQTRPALPRHGVTWDTDIVLKYIKSLSPVKDLSLKDLTFKLVTLTALLSGQRLQCLHLLDIRNMTLTKSVCKFRIGDLVKTSRPGAHQSELSLPAYAPNRRLCIVTAITEYIERTKVLRSGHTQLFISYMKPHSGVSKDTLARWIRTVLVKAGIDMTIFTPHSTRAAAASAASKAVVPLQSILKTAGWSRESTFAKYYKKPLTKADCFGLGVLKRSSEN